MLPELEAKTQIRQFELWQFPIQESQLSSGGKVHAPGQSDDDAQNFYR
jgi:hypothetical protein